MNVFFLSDNKFAEVFAVALQSLFIQQKHTKLLRVFLIENALSEENKDKLNAIANEFGRKIEYIDMPDIQTKMGTDLYIPHRLNIVDYARLLAAEILPNDIDRIIQLDCDLYLRHPIDELWEMNLDGIYCRMINEGHNKRNRKILKIPGEGMYYNSGVVLINLKKWREDRIQEKFIEYIRFMHGYIPINAQGVMNAVMDGKIGLLPLKYNVHTLMYAFSYSDYLKLRRPAEFYTKEEFEGALNDPTIVHFMTCFYFDVRPWMKGCLHPKTGEFLEYRKMTPFADAPLWDPPSRPLRDFYGKMCHVLPKRVVVAISSLIYSYILPAKHMFMERKYCK